MLPQLGHVIVGHDDSACALCMLIRCASALTGIAFPCVLSNSLLLNEAVVRGLTTVEHARPRRRYVKWCFCCVATHTPFPLEAKARRRLASLTCDLARREVSPSLRIACGLVCGGRIYSHVAPCSITYHMKHYCYELRAVFFAGLHYLVCSRVCMSMRVSLFVCLPVHHFPNTPWSIT